MNITGVVKIQDFPEEASLTTVRDLLMSLERYLVVELPTERITNVYVSFNEPNVTERDVVWYRLDAAGNYKGQYIYVGGQWVQMHPPPQEIVKMYGRSDEIPVGYELVSNSIPGFTPDMVSKLITEWEEHPEDAGVYVIFHVVYVGL